MQELQRLSRSHGGDQIEKLAWQPLCDVIVSLELVEVLDLGGFIDCKRKYWSSVGQPASTATSARPSPARESATQSATSTRSSSACPLESSASETQRGTTLRYPVIQMMWPFLEPNVQASLLKVTHIHHCRKRHMQERRSHSDICLYSCLCARQVVPAACVSSPWGLGCTVPGSRKQLTATNRHHTGMGLKCPHLTLGDHCQVGGRPCNWSAILLLPSSKATGRRRRRLARAWADKYFVSTSAVLVDPSIFLIFSRPRSTAFFSYFSCLFFLEKSFFQKKKRKETQTKKREKNENKCK